MPAGAAGREQEGKGPRPREPAGSFNFLARARVSPRAPSVSGPRPPEPPSSINDVPAPAWAPGLLQFRARARPRPGKIAGFLNSASSNLAVSAARAASAPSRFSFEEIDPVTPGRFS